MAVRHAESASQLDQLLTAKADSLVVIDFYAVWCSPCTVISPVIDRYSRSVSNLQSRCHFCLILSMILQFPHVTFVKVDTEKLPDVTKKYGVTAMPTFLFIKQHKIVATIKGADQQTIHAAIVEHATAPIASTSGSSEASDVRETPSSYLIINITCRSRCSNL
jgi:thioredoxin 1